MTDNTIDRALKAVIVGVVTGIIVALVVWLISVLTAFPLDPGFWGTVAGVLAGLYSFLTGRNIV